MTIVLVGGGSGGHITPLLAVAKEIKRQKPKTTICYVGSRTDKLRDVAETDGVFDHIWTVHAGKFRRYHQEGWRQILDVSTLLKNLRDFWYFLIGTWQSFWLLGRCKPEAVFIKGGFVGVPMGLAAALRRTPFITHDSDAVPGLANRIISRWATVHAVALPKNLYTYFPDKVVETGVPVDERYRYVTSKLRDHYRHELGLDKGPVVCIAGGGLGAKRVNEAVMAIAPELISRFPRLQLLHLAGRDHKDEVDKQYQQILGDNYTQHCSVQGFVTDAYRYSGAADVVICRAGATSLAEFAVQAKPCIVIPNPLLTGGHQLKNAQALQKRKAVIVVSENKLQADPTILLSPLSDLLHSSHKRTVYSRALHKFAKKDATQQLAGLIITTGKSHGLSS